MVSIEMEGGIWYDCSLCQYFKPLKSDKKGTKIFLKKEFFGYCLDAKKRESSLLHIIYKQSDFFPKPGFRSPCFKPKSSNENNFLTLMIKQEEDKLMKLLMDPSLSEEERKYFRELKKKYQE